MGSPCVDLALLRAEAARAGFDASLADPVGGMLRVLAASKPGGRILELGTGAGIGTAYLLSGADVDSTLVTIELDPTLSAMAQSQISDGRIEWVIADGGDWLDAQPATRPFDLIFADTWPGKFTHLDRTLDLLAPGGLYVVDDLLPQPNWPDQHQARVDDLLARLQASPTLAYTTLTWSTGVGLGTRLTH